MTHSRRPAYPVEHSGELGTCQVCGKKAYLTRKIARYRGRQLYPGQRIRAYQCDGSPWWHITSQPAFATAAWKDYKAS